MTQRYEDLTDQLTLDEQARLAGGAGIWHTAALPERGIPAVKVSDGPVGVRGESFTTTTSASFPCGSALGATFDTELVKRVGAALAEEARTKGVHVVLGPTINLHRHPLGGRNFEAYSEDPLLTAHLAVAFVRGLQGAGVAACAKHFVANDAEIERLTISSEVDDRTLREVYLRPFEAAVRDAGAWTVMGSYNRLGGTYACEHEWLLTSLLKQEWGFDGLVMSDWHATHDTVRSALAGLDLEMPGPARHFGAPLAQAVRDGASARRGGGRQGPPRAAPGRSRRSHGRSGAGGAVGRRSRPLEPGPRGGRRRDGAAAEPCRRRSRRAAARPRPAAPGRRDRPQRGRGHDPRGRQREGDASPRRHAP